MRLDVRPRKRKSYLLAVHGVKGLIYELLQARMLFEGGKVLQATNQRVDFDASSFHRDTSVVRALARNPRFSDVERGKRKI